MRDMLVEACWGTCKTCVQEHDVMDGLLQEDKAKYKGVRTMALLFCEPALHSFKEIYIKNNQ